MAKAESFAIATLEKFQIITAILKGTCINWSSFLFGILKNMFQSTKLSKGFAIQLCYIFSDSDLLEDEDVTTHKYKVFNAALINQGNRSAAVSNWLKIKRETNDVQDPGKEDEKTIAKGKSVAKASQSKPVEAPKPKSKKKKAV